MVGMLIATFAVVAIALVFAAYGLTQASVFLGIAAALATFAIAAVSLRQWATCDHDAPASEETRRPNMAASPDDHSRRAA